MTDAATEEDDNLRPTPADRDDSLRYAAAAAAADKLDRRRLRRLRLRR